MEVIDFTDFQSEFIFHFSTSRGNMIWIDWRLSPDPP
jgi:hypothetical protein